MRTMANEWRHKDRIGLESEPWPVREYGLVQIRPRARTIVIGRNRTCLVSSEDGSLGKDPGTGLYVHETRILSRYCWFVDGERAQEVVLASPNSHSWLGYYIAPGRGPDGSPVGRPPEQVLELRLARVVGDGLLEEIELVNYTQRDVQLKLALEVDADFATLIDTGRNRQEPGQITRHARSAAGEPAEIGFSYNASNDYRHHGQSGVAETHRSVLVRIPHADTRPRVEEGEQSPRLLFELRLAPRAAWRARVEVSATIDGAKLGPPSRRRALSGPPDRLELAAQAARHFQTRFHVPGEPLASLMAGALHRAADDLEALRLYDLDRGERAWLTAAGLPIYQALFGRDALTAAAQAAMLTPDLLRGTLPELARWQGQVDDDWREEQPGRMLHQMRTGPTAALNVKPWARHYASVTTSGFFASAVDELWRWTGDRAAVGPLLDPALRALRWLDERADLDGDGFFEYRSVSEAPLKNQGWKDSAQAIVYPDGSQVPDPIAVCDLQGFAYMSFLRAAELSWWFGEKSRAVTLFRRAHLLKQRFNELFWMPHAEFFALGLDSQKRQIASVASNAGHLLATGIVDESLVEPTARRLFGRDMFSGWGIRSLSAENPAYNPYAYQRGSVWPVENGTFALGFARYGLSGYTSTLARVQLETAALFENLRLPEVLSGHTRDAECPFPALYPQTNWPQAWSASSMVATAQALVGIYPFAPLHLLLVDPHLPDWLPELSLEGLRVGEAAVSLRFFRRPDGRSDFEVMDARGQLHVVRQPSPWSLVADLPERFEDLLRSLI